LVSTSELDRRGSLIGGVPFLSSKYPDLNLAPLAQLDLDNISNTTGENVGSGLLQVWMPTDLWGQTPNLGDLHLRLIPREAVDGTPELLAGSNIEDAKWIERKAAELEVLRIIDPSRAQEDEEIYQEHYWSGVAGFDWTLSVFSDYENSYSLGKFGAPQQIVDWRPAGFTIPDASIDGSIWDIPDDFHDSFPDLMDDPDFGTICEIMEASPVHPRCALFDVYYDFFRPLYGLESYYGDGSVGWNWRPLFAFPGPISDRVDDQHVVFYRKSDGQFEYAGASMRWNWH
jgi:hypothetical protein